MERAVVDLTDEVILNKFKHIYEQYFDRVDIRRDGQNARFIHGEYSHPRFKRDFVPVMFCGVRVECHRSPAVAK